MDTMTPEEIQDAHIGAVRDHVAEIATMIMVAHFLDEPDKKHISLLYMAQAHAFIMANLTENHLVRIVVQSVWQEAEERARSLVGDIPYAQPGDPPDFERDAT